MMKRPGKTWSLIEKSPKGTGKTYEYKGVIYYGYTKNPVPPCYQKDKLWPYLVNPMQPGPYVVRSRL